MANPTKMPKPDTAELDPVLHAMGFELDTVSPALLAGRLPARARCCQPFKVLHGGVSVLVSEGLASMGAHMASGYRRVAGVHLSINHFRSAAVGDLVEVRDVPVHIGRSTQVWEVKLWKVGPESPETKKTQISESRVTLLCMPVPKNLHPRRRRAQEVRCSGSGSGSCSGQQTGVGCTSSPLPVAYRGKP